MAMPLITPALASANGSSSITAATQPTSITSSSATLDPQALPPVPRILVNDETRAQVSDPVKRIASEADCARWIQSEAYSTYTLFLQRVCEACVGKPTRTAQAGDTAVGKLASLLHKLDAWTDEIEPQKAPQRFGNLAFRDWGARLEAQVDDLHRTLLPPALHAFIPELRSYLLDSFGNFTRIDYGSGHEFAFFAWLGYLYRLSFFDESAAESETELPSKVEEAIGLEVFPLYLQVVWRLQDRYGLEPAGSHGVWGLDDFQFLPYVIGAAQLRQQSTLRPREIVSLCSNSATLSSLTSKTPASLIFSHAVTLPAASLHGKSSEVVVPNLYLSSLLRIGTLKRGPFHEHSPLLHDISTSVPNWIKVYTGMVKMYQAECLNKKVVVQHFSFGGVGWVWNESAAQPQDANVEKPTRGAGLALGGTSGNMGSMGVPTTRMMGAGTSNAPQAPTRAPFTTAPTSRPGAAMLPPTTFPSTATRTARQPAGAMPPTGAPWAQKRPDA